MLLEYLVQITRVVLAAEGEKKAALLVPEQSALESYIGIAGILGSQGNAMQTILADNATPEGVVRVKHDHLRLGLFERSPYADDASSDLAGAHRGKREAE